MADYPYVNTTGKFKEFMIKIQTVGMPAVSNVAYVKSLGFRTSNHSRFPVIFRWTPSVGQILSDIK